MRFPVVNEVEAYWDALRDGRAMPTRGDVDPRGLERALDHAFILERVAPGVVRVRLSGQHLNDLMGMDPRGMPLSAFFTAEARPELAGHLEAVFDAPQTVRLILSGERGIGRPALAGEMLLLPLHNEMGQVTRALGCLASDGRIGRAPRRFRIASARAAPLARTRQTGTGTTPAAHGFAEAPAPFTQEKGPDAVRPTLTLIKPDV
ncbi:PAS domain-containing protein [Actibacterium sp. D379-3]